MKSKIVDSAFVYCLLNFPIFKPSLRLILFCLVTFMESKSLAACDILVAKSNLYITIERGSKQKITAKDLLDIGYCEDRQYQVSWVQNGVLTPLDSLSDQLPKYLRFHVADLSNQHFCFGDLQLIFVDCIEDLVPKQVDTLFISECARYGTFNLQGFELPDSVKINFVNGEYLVSGWSRCGIVKIRITDIISTKLPKDSIYEHIETLRFRITRTDNISFNFSNIILYKRPVFDSTVYFPNFDGVENPIFDCGDHWEKDRNGNPTAKYVLPKKLYDNDCTFFAYNYVDSLISVIDTICSSTKIVERKWTFINWDNGRNYTFNQKIHIQCIKDLEPPTAKCKSEIVEFKLDSSQTIKINANQFDDGSTDNCGIRSISFDSIAAINSLLFDIQDTGKIIDVDIWIHDHAGNKTKCTSQIRVSEDKVVSNFNPDGGNNMVLSLSPNPFIQTTQLNIFSSYDSKVQVTVYSNEGWRVMSKNIMVKEGYNSIALPELFYLKSGLYLIQCQSVREIYMIRGIKL